MSRKNLNTDQTGRRKSFALLDLGLRVYPCFGATVQSSVSPSLMTISTLAKPLSIILLSSRVSSVRAIVLFAERPSYRYRATSDGDLDPVLSRHTLVPLKVAYKKLRLLVDLGCFFIGHGLTKDFRIISIKIFCRVCLLAADSYPLYRYLCSTRQSPGHGRYLLYSIATEANLPSVPLVVCLETEYSDWGARFHRRCPLCAAFTQSIPGVRRRRHLGREIGGNL